VPLYCAASIASRALAGPRRAPLAAERS